jgi:hypothetical protein
MPTSALEYGDSMFLRNVGIDQHINMAQKPKNRKNTILRKFLVTNNELNQRGNLRPTVLGNDTLAGSVSCSPL